MAEATITCSASPCVVQLQITHPLLDLTAEQGAEIAFAIVAVWAIGAVYASLIRLIRNDGSTTTEERD